MGRTHLDEAAVRSRFFKFREGPGIRNCRREKMGRREKSASSLRCSEPDFCESVNVGRFSRRWFEVTAFSAESPRSWAQNCVRFTYWRDTLAGSDNCFGARDGCKKAGRGQLSRVVRFGWRVEDSALPSGSGVARLCPLAPKLLTLTLTRGNGGFVQHTERPLSPQNDEIEVDEVP
jgi:hypothetical protein